MENSKDRVEYQYEVFRVERKELKRYKLVILILFCEASFASQALSQSRDTLLSPYNVQPWILLSVSERFLVGPITHIEAGMPISLGGAIRLLYGLGYERETDSTYKNETKYARFCSASLVPGINGYRMSLGYMFLFSGTSHNAEFGVLEPRISLFRTWREFRFARPHETYLGIECAIPSFCFGYYFHLNNSPNGTGSFFSWQLVMGF